MKNVLLWILILPLAILAAFLIDFPVHWTLYVTLSHFVEPYPHAPEEIIVPFFRAFIFVYVSYLIAPNNKKKTAFIFMIIWLILPTFLPMLMSYIPEFNNSKINYKYYGIPLILGLIGAVCGYLYVRKIEKEENEAIE